MCILLNFYQRGFSSKFEVFQPFLMLQRSLFDAKKLFLPPQLRKVRWQIPQRFLFSLFLPHHYLNLHSCHNRNSFISCGFHQNHPHEKCEKHHHFKTKNDFPFGIGEEFHTHVFFTRMPQSRCITSASLPKWRKYGIIQNHHTLNAILFLPWQQMGRRPPRAKTC